MNSIETLLSGVPLRASSKLERWKIAIAICGAVAMAPVTAMVALLLIGSVLPILLLATPFLAVSQSHPAAQGPQAPLTTQKRTPPPLLPAPSPV
jgi:hypothetical protein